MANRSRSESPLVGDLGYEAYDGSTHSGTSARNEFPLYQATIARKRAEQDSILLANRIRMLRREEEQTRRKIADTEKKTRDVFDLRRRNEEKRVQKEMEDARRETEVEALRQQQMLEKVELQQKLQERQRSIADQKSSLSKVVRQEREVHMQVIQQQAVQRDREAFARAEKVRRETANASRSRARSEGAKQENARLFASERIMREEEMCQNRLTDIERMEREEAQLIARLAQSQERHRAAFMQLEDAIQNGGGGIATSSSSGKGCNTPLTVEDCFGPGAASRAAANADIAARAALGQRSGAVGAARPPRPRGPPISAGSSCTTPSGAAVARMPSKRNGSKENAPGYAISNCSTASGDGSRGTASRGALSSAGSTPTGSSPVAGKVAASTAAAAAAAVPAEPLKYTTVDGTTLEIPEEQEDLDLASLLCT